MTGFTLFCFSLLEDMTWGNSLLCPWGGKKVPSVGLKWWEHHYRNRSQGPSRWLCPNYWTCTAQWWLIFPVSKENIQKIKRKKPQDTIRSISNDNLAVLVRWLGWGLSCQLMDRECRFYNYKLYLEYHYESKIKMKKGHAQSHWYWAQHNGAMINLIISCIGGVLCKHKCFAVSPPNCIKHSQNSWSEFIYCTAKHRQPGRCTQ